MRNFQCTSGGASPTNAQRFAHLDVLRKALQADPVAPEVQSSRFDTVLHRITTTATVNDAKWQIIEMGSFDPAARRRAAVRSLRKDFKGLFGSSDEFLARRHSEDSD